MQKVPSEHQKTLLYCGGDPALAQADHRARGVSTLGDGILGKLLQLPLLELQQLTL